MLAIKIHPTNPTSQGQHRRFEVIVEGSTTRARCGSCQGTGSRLAIPSLPRDCVHCHGHGFHERPANLTLASYDEARIAKAFRKAVDWALNDQEMTPTVAILYAQEVAREEVKARLETHEPDEHFIK